MAQTTIVREEAERFGRLAADWWDPDGRSAMLHKLNPVRLKYIRDQIDQYWQCNECSRTPLEGKAALDVGCGAGLLAEPLVRLGAKVTGIDASPEVIEVAWEHARRQGLEIDYRAGDVVIFSVYTVHGGTDNHSKSFRLSTDTRYQRADAPIDERWIGETPPGHGPKGKRGRIC